MSWKRSRHGLTRCRSCGAHIAAGASPSETHCGFCETDLLARPKATSLPGRGGIIAASLFALTGVACGSSEPPVDPDPVVTPSPDPSGGTAMDDPDDPDGDEDPTWDESAPPEPVLVQEYGAVPDFPEDEIRDEPMYGEPPQ